MPRCKLAVSDRPGWAGLALIVLSALGDGGCAKEAGPMTWKDLQPRYFEALSLQDEETQRGLPEFEQRLEGIVKGILQRLDDGELTEEDERAEAGLTLFYQAFLLQAGQQAIEDGYLKPKDFLRPQRYAAGGDDRAEQIARLARSAELLRKAAELRPDDSRLAALTLGSRYNRESLDQLHSPALLLDMLTAARTDEYNLWSTLVLWRVPQDNPANAAHMEQLLAAVCDPKRLDCSRPPAAPPRPLDGEHKLTREVAAPVMASDLLMRRAEALLASADNAPTDMARMPLLAEALTRLQFAQGTLGLVDTSVADPALSHYPARSGLPSRLERIELLLTATKTRMAGMMNPLSLPDLDYYASRSYRAAYQCVACHTRGSTTIGFPK